MLDIKVVISVEAFGYRNIPLKWTIYSCTQRIFPSTILAGIICIVESVFMCRYVVMLNVDNTWELYTCDIKFFGGVLTKRFLLLQFSEWSDHDREIPDIGEYSSFYHFFLFCFPFSYYILDSALPAIRIASRMGKQLDENEHVERDEIDM